MQNLLWEKGNFMFLINLTIIYFITILKTGMLRTLINGILIFAFKNNARMPPQTYYKEKEKVGHSISSLGQFCLQQGLILHRVCQLKFWKVKEKSSSHKYLIRRSHNSYSCSQECPISTNPEDQCSYCLENILPKE